MINYTKAINGGTFYFQHSWIPLRWYIVALGISSRLESAMGSEALRKLCGLTA